MNIEVRVVGVGNNLSTRMKVPGSSTVSSADAGEMDDSGGQEVKKYEDKSVGTKPTNEEHSSILYIDPGFPVGNTENQ